jgi:hypothetical protein
MAATGRVLSFAVDESSHSAAYSLNVGNLRDTGHSDEATSPAAMADYVDHLIMWSCHSELSREPCTVRLSQSNWLYEVIIISEV